MAFEMLYSMLDIENHASTANSRKGILNELEETIRKTFYSNEEDATKYYMEKLTRKKDLGGKYDQRFLDLVLSEDEEYPEEGTDEGELIE